MNAQRCNDLRLTGSGGANRVMEAELKRLVMRSPFDVRLDKPKREGEETLLYAFDARVGWVAACHHRTSSRISWDLCSSPAVRLEPLFADLLHVLPKRFVRIRYFGVLAARCRTHALAQCRQALAVDPTPAPADVPVASRPRRTWPCPRCGAPMRVVERLTARQLFLDALLGGPMTLRGPRARPTPPAAIAHERAMAGGVPARRVRPHARVPRPPGSDVD